MLVDFRKNKAAKQTAYGGWAEVTQTTRKLKHVFAPVERLGLNLARQESIANTYFDGRMYTIHLAPAYILTGGYQVEEAKNEYTYRVYRRWTKDGNRRLIRSGNRDVTAQ